MRISDWSSDVCSSDLFNAQAEPLEGELKNADLHICNWFAGRLTPDMEAASHAFGALPVVEARASRAAAKREQLRPLMGDEIDRVCDAELVDSIYYSIFPNISPWGCYNPIFYRFRPDGRSEERSVGKECVSPCRSRGSPDH